VPPNPHAGWVAQDVEGEWIVEDFLVEIGRAVDYYDPLALLDLHPGKLVVLEGGPLE